MFDRVEYKRIAKKQLKGRWGTPVLATASILAIILIINIPQAIEMLGQRSGDGLEFERSSPLAGLSELIVLGIVGILTLAYTKLFVDLWKTRNPLPFSAFLSAFSLWLKGVLGMFWMYLWVLLWSCLCFIPGIVKAYAYSQMFFILAENPKVGVRKAMKLSIEITRGYKGDLFVMDLSFIGWSILAGLTGGLLSLYVVPYMQMSKTNAYKMLKAMALQSGRVSPADFGDMSGPDETQGAYTAQKAPADGSGPQNQAAAESYAPQSPLPPAGQEAGAVPQEQDTDTGNLPPSSSSNI